MPTTIRSKIIFGTIYAIYVKIQAETPPSQQSVKLPGNADDQDRAHVSDSNHFTLMCIGSLTTDRTSWLKPRLVQAFKKRRT
tara:strand:- start:12552 stop:12797 length:246 start_codon:yes stop_codon:yes gene_type:complete